MQSILAELRRRLPECEFHEEGGDLYVNVTRGVEMKVPAGNNVSAVLLLEGVPIPVPVLEAQKLADFARKCARPQNQDIVPAIKELKKRLGIVNLITTMEKPKPEE